MKRLIIWASLGFLVALGGCSTIDPADLARTVAQSGGLQAQDLRAGRFVLRTYGRIRQPGAPLDIYIEGDGFAWATRYDVSDDPTPHDPVGLKLAALDPAANVVYIARPCQYVMGANPGPCRYQYWTSHRFAPEVVEAVAGAIEQWKSRGGASTLHLIGYSGGAAVALLAAAGRTDVSDIRTVAGNLDHVTLNRQQGVDQLTGSLNAADIADRIAGIPQIHFLGGADTLVTREVADGYLRKVRDRSCIAVRVIPGNTHQAGWDAQWAALLRQSFPACPTVAPKQT